MNPWAPRGGFAPQNVRNATTSTPVTPSASKPVEPTNHSHWIFDKKDLEEETPSRADGISAEEEAATINGHVEKILECASGLKMHGVPSYVAIILFRRFVITPKHFLETTWKRRERERRRQ